MSLPPHVPLVTSDLLSALCSCEGRRIDVNDSWRDVFGDTGLWDRLPEEDVRFAKEYTTEAARGSMVSHQVFLVERPGEDVPVPVLLHFLPVRLDGTAPGQFPVTITGEVLREPASWAAEQTRRRRMEMLGRMSMGVAHDFNNLLTTVLGHAELLRSDLARLGAGDYPYTHLQSLEQAAQDGAALVRKIQQYIRNEAQEHREPVSLHGIAKEVMTLTRPYWHNEPRRRGIAIQVVEELEPVPQIQGAPAELREVLVNLVLNAVQAMPAGGTLTFRTARHGDRAVAVEIGDTGVGMNEAVRRRIFEPLYTTKGTGGSGMGLTMSQGIVHEHNGRIELESEPGRGTLFRLVFPLARADDSAPGLPDAPAAPEAASDALRILVVDDELMVRTVTTKLLQLRNHVVQDVDGAPAALAALEATPGYDIVVTDLSMPEMNGMELAAEIRRLYPALPVLLLTGDTDVEDPAGLLSGVVKKPFQLDALIAAIREAVTPGQLA
ncbi:MAG: ATP-binding protein [Bacteroidota bacterium]